MEGTYKELEFNLLELTEELLRTQAEMVNLRFHQEEEKEEKEEKERVIK